MSCCFERVFGKSSKQAQGKKLEQVFVNVVYKNMSSSLQTMTLSGNVCSHLIYNGLSVLSIPLIHRKQ